MLFTARADDFESEKERNLYYKFFAGYFLNELIPGIEGRLAALCKLLNDCKRGGNSISHRPIELTAEGVHVSFDNHGYLLSGVGTDRGEFADILIHDRSTHVLIPIEAKVHSNWSYEKDVLSNEKRIGLIEIRMPGTYVIPCLLVTKDKWIDCTRQQSKEYSNYRQLIEADGRRTRVIFWEELIAIADNDRVVDYVTVQLARPHEGFGYSFEQNWFVRQRRNTKDS